ncbi:hypothetical protein [Neisseria sp. Ec49-e6-T10]|uniref:hypothetical protein n=1 Tax=Neisseria sp. Ec49-e6-T10 TaxID=3140744 RepID=UPI003EBEF227
MMRIALTLLIPIFLLMGCSNEPVAWEDKTPEQQHKESSWLTGCHARHIETRDWDACKVEFEKEFGYPFNRP